MSHLKHLDCESDSNESAADDDLVIADEHVQSAVHNNSQLQFSEVSETMDCEGLADWLQRKGIPESFCCILKGISIYITGP